MSKSGRSNGTETVAITAFKQDPERIVEKVRSSKKPLIITRRGHSAAVLEDVRQYETRLRRLELLEAVVRGLRASQEGRLLENADVMRRLREVVTG